MHSSQQQAIVTLVVIHKYERVDGCSALTLTIPYQHQLLKAPWLCREGSFVCHRSELAPFLPVAMHRVDAELEINSCKTKKWHRRDQLGEDRW